MTSNKSTYQHILEKTELKLKPNWHSISTIDLHTGGEPLRVIVSGFPELKGNSVLEYRAYCKKHFDYLRTALLFEPRGHADMYGCILVPPNDTSGDFGVLFIHNEGYSTMCGHAIIALATLAVEMQWISVVEGINTLKIDAPCGRITAFATVKNNTVEGVAFHCVPSYVVSENKTITLPEWGTITYDIAFGGAYYAYVDLAKNSLPIALNTANYDTLIQLGKAIKKEVIDKDKTINHPFESDLSFLYGTIFIGAANYPNNHSRNVCVFAEGEVDRCPTGSGVSGRMALHYKRNEVLLNEKISIESITNSTFNGSVVSETTFGKYNAIIPRVEGTAHITGKHTFIIDPNDPMKDGFILR